jgi:hypothetical protein
MRGLQGLRDLFTPSTEWHPYTGTDRSPHYQHRQTLGRYEVFANRLVHGFPIAPIGLYVFLPLVMLWTARRAWQFTRLGDSATVIRGAVLSMCLLNIAYVVAISSAVTFLESSRYRYQVESLIWVVTAFCLADVWQSVRRHLNRKTVSHPQFP